MNTHSADENQHENVPRGYLWGDDLIAKRDALLYDHRSLEERLAEALAQCDDDEPEAGHFIPEAAPAKSAETVAVNGFAADEVESPSVKTTFTPPLHPHNTSPIHVSTPSLSHTKTKRSRDWKKKMEHEKIAPAVSHLQEREGRDWTLRLNPDLIETLRNVRDPAAAMYQRLFKAFQKEGLDIREWGFVLEEAETGLHLHGFVEPLADRQAFRRALCAAGGSYASPANQVHIGSKPLYARVYETRSGTKTKSWASYCTKSWNKTAHYLGTDKLSYLSQPLRRAAKDFHEESRLSTRH